MSFLDKLIERGKSLLGPIHKPELEHAVEHDRFDAGYWRDVRHNVPAIDALATDLGRHYDYVEPFMQDLFMSTYKADPQLVDDRDMKPSHIPNKTMLSELTSTTQFKALRAQTRGDEYGSAMALMSMESAVRDAQVSMVEARKRAQEAQQLADEAAKAQEQFQIMCGGMPGGGSGGNQPGPPGSQPGGSGGSGQGPMTQGPVTPGGGNNGQPATGPMQGPAPDPTGQGPQGNHAAGLQQAMTAAEQAAAAAQAAQQAAQAAAELAAAGMRQALKNAADQAGKDLDEEQKLMQAFGVEDGTLQRMDFEQRRSLAERLRNNRLAQFYKLLGQFKMIQQAESRKRIVHAADEVAGVKLDDNLTRMIPAEMINLASPELEVDFWRRYADRELLCYDLRGKENMGQGPVICVVDESGSMDTPDVAGGTREAWSKALALAMCDQARMKGRDFHYIGFSSSRQQWVQSFPNGQTTIEGVLTMTEHFYGGGTSYETPLRQALALIESTYDGDGKGKPDIVFMTDDEYGQLDADFMAEWNRVKDKTGIRCFGIAIGCSYGGALAAVSDNVRSVAELTESDPRAMADLFRTV